MRGPRRRVDGGDRIGTRQHAGCAVRRRRLGLRLRRMAARLALRVAAKAGTYGTQLTSSTGDNQRGGNMIELRTADDVRCALGWSRPVSTRCCFATGVGARP